MFKTNIGPADRSLRVVGGFVLFTVSYWNLWLIPFAVSVVMLATGLSGNCPLYSVLRISTDRHPAPAGTK
jgi:hypothetical protein